MAGTTLVDCLDEGGAMGVPLISICSCKLAVILSCSWTVLGAARDVESNPAPKDSLRDGKLCRLGGLN